MDTKFIPVSRPFLGQEEEDAVLSALQGGHISGTSGSHIEEFERRFAEYCGVRHAVSVNSGTSALHLACIASWISSGDEVLVSAATNIATANAVVQCGAKIVPIDCDPFTWNMDVALLSGALTAKTKAIIVVHLYGQPADMTEITAFAQKHGLFVIEDAAQAHGAQVGLRRVGSLGEVGCFSFYANKIITTGEGGMVVTDSEAVAQRVRLLRNLAFTSPRFRHAEVGFNFRMTNLQAAIGCAQLAKIDDIIAMKERVAAVYSRRLKNVTGLQLPLNPPGSVCWMYGLVVTNRFAITRDALMKRLADASIETRTMFCPMNMQPALMPHLAVSRECPSAERLWVDGFYVPSSPDMSAGEIARVCQVIEEAA